MEENYRNKLHKIEILVLKVLPMCLALLSLLSTIFDRYDIDSTILCYIMMFIIYLFIYISSYVFKFCSYHRMFIHYILVVNLISIYDVYWVIPLDDYELFNMYMIISGIFLFIILYLHVKSNKKPSVENNR